MSANIIYHFQYFFHSISKFWPNFRVFSILLEYFQGWDGVLKLFKALFTMNSDFCFLTTVLFLLYHWWGSVVVLTYNKVTDQIQFWLFSFCGCSLCLALQITSSMKKNKFICPHPITFFIEVHQFSLNLNTNFLCLVQIDIDWITYLFQK